MARRNRERGGVGTRSLSFQTPEGDQFSVPPPNFRGESPNPQPPRRISQPEPEPSRGTPPASGGNPQPAPPPPQPTNYTPPILIEGPGPPLLPASGGGGTQGGGTPPVSDPPGSAPSGGGPPTMDQLRQMIEEAIGQRSPAPTPPPRQRSTPPGTSPIRSTEVPHHVSTGPGGGFRQLTSRMQQEAMRRLENPSVFDDELFQQQLEKGRQLLEADLARRGILESTAGSQLFGSEVLRPLLQQRQNNLAAARQQAMQGAGRTANLQADARFRQQQGQRAERQFTENLRQQARNQALQQAMLTEQLRDQRLQSMQGLLGGLFSRTSPQQALSALGTAGGILGTAGAGLRGRSGQTAGTLGTLGQMAQRMFGGQQQPVNVPAPPSTPEPPTPNIPEPPSLAEGINIPEVGPPRRLAQIEPPRRRLGPI